MNTPHDVRLHFENIADDYDAWKRKNSYYHELLKGFYRSSIPPGSDVIEYGCATGDILASTLPKKGLGVDFSQRLVAHARRKHPSLEFVAADAGDFASDRRFDYCIMSDLLDHVADIPRVLANAYQHLEPGGRLVCTTINPLWNPLMDFFERLHMKMPEGPHAFIPNRYLAAFCRMKGFDIVAQVPLIALPKNIPFLAPILNSIVPRLPLLNRFCWVQGLIAEKRGSPVRRLSYSVLIPVYNEEKNIEECVNRIPPLGPDYEILIVDDGSTDASKEVFERLQRANSRVRVVSLPKNQGKAAALEAGIKQAAKDAVIILDADMAVAPEDVPLFAEALEQGLGRFVNGTRLVYGMEKKAMSELKRIGNFMFALCLSFFLKFRLTDTLCGTKAFFRDDFSGVAFRGEKWGDFVLLAHAGKKRLPIVEIPLHYHARKAGSSKMNVLGDGLRFAWYILKMAFCAAAPIGAILYCAGVLHWLFFFNFGRFPLAAFDWPKEHGYLSILRQALVNGTVPFHVSTVFQTTDRFLALPETLLSPQIALLPFLSPQAFIVINTLILYSAGFIGCLLIARRYRMSAPVFATLFLLFNFNGYITSHLSVGHFMWLGYFLLPFFCLLLLELVETPGRLSTSVKLSFLLFVMNLQGAFHIFVWCAVFMAFLGAAQRSARRQILIALGLGAAASAFRLIPAALTFYHKGYPFVFISAYPTIAHFCDALIVLHGPGYCPFAMKMGWWEFDAYVSAIGALFLGYFGLYARAYPGSRLRHLTYRAFDLPLVAMFLLSVGILYPLIAKLPVPFLNSQRFSSRFIIVPLVMLLIIACVRFQALLAGLRLGTMRRALIWILPAALAFLLVRHSYIWSAALFDTGALAPALPVNPVIIIKQDVFYHASVIASSLASAVSLIAMFFLSVSARLH